MSEFSPYHFSQEKIDKLKGSSEEEKNSYKEKLRNEYNRRLWLKYAESEFLTENKKFTLGEVLDEIEHLLKRPLGSLRDNKESEIRDKISVKINSLVDFLSYQDPYKKKLADAIAFNELDQFVVENPSWKEDRQKNTSPIIEEIHAWETLLSYLNNLTIISQQNRQKPEAELVTEKMSLEDTSSPKEESVSKGSNDKTDSSEVKDSFFKTEYWQGLKKKLLSIRSEGESSLWSVLEKTKIKEGELRTILDSTINFQINEIIVLNERLLSEAAAIKDQLEVAQSSNNDYSSSLKIRNELTQLIGQIQEREQSLVQAEIISRYASLARQKQMLQVEPEETLNEQISAFEKIVLILNNYQKESAGTEESYEDNIFYIAKAVSFLAEKGEENPVYRTLNSLQPSDFLNQLLSRINRIKKEYFEKVRGLKTEHGQAKEYLDINTYEIFRDKAYYRPGLVVEKEFKMKLQAENWAIQSHYSFLSQLALQAGEEATSQEYLKIPKEFSEIAEALRKVTANGLYGEGIIDQGNLSCDEDMILFGGRDRDKTTSKGLANVDAKEANTHFNKTQLFNIKYNFDYEKQLNTNRSTQGKLQKAVARAAEILQGINSDYGDKFRAGSSSFYGSSNGVSLVEAIFNEPEFKDLFKYETPEVLRFYIELVAFKISRDNLAQKYARRALADYNEALKYAGSPDPRPNGLLCSMVYQLIHGKAEGHLGCSEFIDLTYILKKLKKFSSDQTDPKERKKEKEKKKKNLQASYAILEEYIETYKRSLAVAHPQEIFITSSAYIPSYLHEDFPDIDFLFNQVDEDDEELDGSGNPIKKSIISANDYKKAGNALLKVIEQAVAGVKPEEVIPSNIPKLIGEINSLFSMILGVSGLHESKFKVSSTSNDKKPGQFDFTNDLALAAFKAHIKHILENVPGVYTVDPSGNLTKSGAEYVDNYNRIFNAILEVIGDTNDARLKSTVVQEIRGEM